MEKCLKIQILASQDESVTGACKYFKISPNITHLFTIFYDLKSLRRNFCNSKYLVSLKKIAKQKKEVL